jgi:hypothetical protein
LSDVIASLFDRNWGHPFAIPIFRRLLQTIASGNFSQQPNIGSMDRILKTLVPNVSQLFVRRERRGDSSRVDIDIYAAGSSSFLLCIEHKIRGGRETAISGKRQTVRQWQDAVGRAQRLGIGRDNVVGIFLTPGGEPAADENFVPVSFKQFSDVVRAAVIGDGRQGSSCRDLISSSSSAELEGAGQISEVTASILGFMSFYGRS